MKFAQYLFRPTWAWAGIGLFAILRDNQFEFAPTQCAILPVVVGYPLLTDFKRQFPISLRFVAMLCFDPARSP